MNTDQMIADILCQRKLEALKETTNTCVGFEFAILRQSTSLCLSHKNGDMLDFIQNVCIKHYCAALMSVLLLIQDINEKRGIY